MKTGMNITELLTEVDRQSKVKRDFLASTKESIRMVQSPEGLHIVLFAEGAEKLERFTISESFHRQVSGRLSIPWKYYQRLLQDHTDLVIDQVNALFEREPETRLVRTLDGTARAFLSDRYRRVDNDEMLSNVLPPLVKGEVENELLSSYVGADKMYLKILFTDDALAQDIGEMPAGRNTFVGGQWGDHKRDIVRPGAIISNSETGHGGMRVSGFFYRDFCRNGCVYGRKDAFSFSRPHLGGKLVADSGIEIFSDETKRMQDQVIMAEMNDALSTMTDPRRVQAMGDRLRAIKNGVEVTQPVAAVDALAKELEVTETEKAGILEAFIGDRDYSQWGMVNAVTVQANKEDVSYERACEFEELGAKLIDMNLKDWGKIAEAELVAA